MHSTNDINDGYLGSGKVLIRSIKKYGIHNHSIEILYHCKNREELINKEREIVNDNLIKEDLCMNIMRGGKGGFISEEQQRGRSIKGGISFSNRLKNDESFFKEHSERSSSKMKKLHIDGKVNYNTFQGKNHKDESKKKIGEKNKITQLGCNNSQYGTCWIYNLDGVNKKIKIEELESHLNMGWIKGRKI